MFGVCKAFVYLRLHDAAVEDGVFGVVWMEFATLLSLRVLACHVSVALDIPSARAPSFARHLLLFVCIGLYQMRGKHTPV